MACWTRRTPGACEAPGEPFRLKGRPPLVAPTVARFFTRVRALDPLRHVRIGCASSAPPGCLAGGGPGSLRRDYEPHPRDATPAPSSGPSPETPLDEQG